MKISDIIAEGNTHLKIISTFVKYSSLAAIWNVSKSDSNGIYRWKSI